MASQLLSDELIEGFKNRLADHPIYRAIDSLQRLQQFMEHHVYSVWDFMSLIKYLQHQVAPTRFPWAPGEDGDIQRFINELVLEEESDEAPPGGGQSFGSHYELYRGAMAEIGADNRTIQRFVATAVSKGIEAALALPEVPDASQRFTTTTFDFIQSGKPHQVAAALALGREHIIPTMFRELLGRIGVDEQQAPTFHYYLKRHIHLDEDFHAPLSLRLLQRLCDNDPQKEVEAIEAAHRAVDARLAFWDGVLESLGSTGSPNRLLNYLY